MTMGDATDKRYQVFVSSTFDDLQIERQRVAWTLQAMACIPAGMELFPASSDSQSTVIKKVIDDCDYYLLIIAGRYGSLDKDGIGYTEKKFDYAVSSEKPIVSFLHKHPGSLSFDKSEQNAENREKLKTFRKKVEEGRTVQYWTTPDELASKVSTSLHALFKSHPAEGWVKGRYATNAGKLNRLRARISDIEAQLHDALETDGTSSTSLSQECKNLLIEASKSISKYIMAVGVDGGFEIQAGELIVREVDGAHSCASYKEAVEELASNGLIRELNDGLYEITGSGYKAIKEQKPE